MFKCCSYETFLIVGFGGMVSSGKNHLFLGNLSARIPLLNPKNGTSPQMPAHFLSSQPTFHRLAMATTDASGRPRTLARTIQFFIIGLAATRERL
jgi:hypothetical protein